MGVTALGVGIWAVPQVSGEHVTKCGVDALGPYAEVRITSIKGALGSTRLRDLHVRFAYDNHVYDAEEEASVILSGFHTYGRVHGRYPPRQLGQYSEVTVPGRTVYRIPRPVLLSHGRNGYSREYAPGRFESKASVEQFTRLHPSWRAANPTTEVVPDDPSKIRCILYSVNQDSD